MLGDTAKAMNYADLDACTRPSARTTCRPRRSRRINALREAAPSRRRRCRPPSASRAAPRRPGPAGVHVEGLDDVFVRLSRCCTPVPGDEIIGFVTRGRGVSVHRADCANAVSLASGQADRLIDVEWDIEPGGVFMASVEVKALDRARLLRDVTTAFADHHVNILSCTTQTGIDRVSKMRFDLELGDPRHLDSLLSTIRGSTASTTHIGSCRVRAADPNPPRLAGTPARAVASSLWSRVPSRRWAKSSTSKRRPRIPPGSEPAR